MSVVIVVMFSSAYSTPTWQLYSPPVSVSVAWFTIGIWAYHTSSAGSSLPHAVPNNSNIMPVKTIKCRFIVDKG